MTPAVIKRTMDSPCNRHTQLRCVTGVDECPCGAPSRAVISWSSSHSLPYRPRIRVKKDVIVPVPTIPDSPDLFWLRVSRSGFSGNGYLCTYRVSTDSFTVIAPFSVAIQDIAFHPNGTLYALGTVGTTLYTCNKDTGVCSLIGNTGLGLGNSLTHTNGLECSPTGVLYTSNATLYTLSKTTGTATAIGVIAGSNPVPNDNYWGVNQDIAWANGKLYGACFVPQYPFPGGRGFVEVDPVTGNSTAVLADIGTSSWGMVGFTNRFVYFARWVPPMNMIREFDLSNNTFRDFCVVQSQIDGANVIIGGMTMLYQDRFH